MKCFFQHALTRQEFFLLLGALILQLLIAAIPDPFPGGAIFTDIDDYRRWCRVLVLQGLEAAYWGDAIPRVDYPPLIPYLYFLLGSAVQGLSTSLFLNDAAMNFLIKWPSIACNLMMSALLLRECHLRRIDLDRCARWVLVMSPPFIFDTSYWGQTDSVVSLLLLGSFLALQKQRLTLCYGLFTLACFAKPLAWPFAVLIAWVSLRQFSLRAVASSFAVALLLAGLLLLPFILNGNGWRIINDIFLQHLDTMPYISVNAHNLWWIIATDLMYWTNSAELWLGLIPYKWLATGLFLGVYAALLGIAHRHMATPSFDVLKVAAMVAISFFMLAPHMHENHLLNFFPLGFLFCVAQPEQRAFRIGYLLLLGCSTINMLVHDPYLVRYVAKYQYLLLVDIGDISQGAFSILSTLFWVVITKINAVISVVIFAWWLWIYLCCDVKTKKPP